MKKNQCVNRMIEVNSHVGGIYVSVLISNSWNNYL